MGNVERAVSLIGEYWWMFIVVACFLIWAIEQKEEAKKLALSLAFQAERAAMVAVGTGIMVTGPDRMANVVESLIATMPIQVKAVLALMAALSCKDLDTFILDLCQKVYDESKERYQEWIMVNQ